MKTCYISASLDAVPRLGTLYAVLESRGVRSLVPTDLLGPGGRWFEVVADTIRGADWVLGIPSSAGDNEMVFFELGIASALGKRCVIIAEPELPLPLAFESLFLLRTSLNNVQALEFGMDRLLRAKKTRRAKPKRSTQHHVLGPVADQFLDHLAVVIARKDHAGLETLVQSALQHAGVTAMASYLSEGDWRYDVVAWVDELQPYVGNPLPIEVKFAVNEPSTLKRLARPNMAGSHWALLVYVDGPPAESPVWRNLPSTVLRIRLRDLLERLRDEPFVEIVRDLRNRVVHGMAG